MDPSFGNGGEVVNSGQLHLPSMAVQPDGKVVTAAATVNQGINLNFDASNGVKSKHLTFELEVSEWQRHRELGGFAGSAGLRQHSRARQRVCQFPRAILFLSPKSSTSP